MDMTQVPRFIAPHFIEIEGSADIPGSVRRACAFTTAAPGLARDSRGASHHHRCELLSETGHGMGEWQDSGPVTWRTETRSTTDALAPPVTAEGSAPDLMQAIAAALGAAHAHAPHGGAPVYCVAPGVVEMVREPGMPRVWIGSHLSANGQLPSGQPWSHLMTAFIREWPSAKGGASAFRCELEMLPYAAVMPGQGSAEGKEREWQIWHAPSLEEAIRGCHQRIFAPRDETFDAGC
ncbi:hypothetical protein BKE38_27275 [Pseudoroseomonas deserti]|uniref:Uncharacterized protein n=1 Tax=Teichococcus deserti TaxID=1817963 RepID=A0A1V2GUC1_9PROT|nr:hypothetical protein [Pseudoroseomonas deserti]ONG44808.1 hypothetical protein BKE38_27275 [Pseudoroseomonas deserti]